MVLAIATIFLSWRARRTTAYKVGGLVDAALSEVYGVLGVRAKRTGTVGPWAEGVGGNDGCRRLLGFHPALQSRQRVERVGTRASVAVVHPRGEEQARMVCEMPSMAPAESLVVLDRAVRGLSDVTPALIDQQLASRSREFRDVAPDRVEDLVHRLEKGEVGAEIEDPPVVARDVHVERQVTEVLVHERQLEWRPPLTDDVGLLYH
jgi:hypothetical protein